MNMKARALDDETENLLWRRWRDAEDVDARERLISNFLPYTRIIAGRLYVRRPCDGFEFDEYLQMARVGLLEAVDRFDPARGARFITYASRRMIGSILTGVERLSEVQQQVAFRKRLESERMESLKEPDTGDTSEPDALFRQLAELGVGLALCYLLDDTGMVMEPDRVDGRGHYEAVELRQMQRRLHALVDRLPDKEQYVLRHHYMQDVPFQDIASRLGVTKGRVSQIHRSAIDSLRKEIARERLGPFFNKK